MKKILLILCWLLFLSYSIEGLAQKKGSTSKTKQKQSVMLYLPDEFFGKWVISIDMCNKNYNECDEEGEPFVLKKASNGIQMSGPRWGSKIYSISKISEDSYKIKYKEMHCELDWSDTSLIIILTDKNKLVVDSGHEKVTHYLCE
jgi:hypothetical protein